jgi:DNA-binding MarR family transcriptional regulator
VAFRVRWSNLEAVTRTEAPRRQLTELDRAAAFRTELRRFLRRTDEVTAKAGLTSQRYDLLLMLHAAESRGEVIRVTALCELLHLPQTAVTELVKRAEEANLVERRAFADDGRVSLLRVTATGARRLKEAFDELSDDRAALAEALTLLDERLRRR